MPLHGVIIAIAQIANMFDVFVGPWSENMYMQFDSKTSTYLYSASKNGLARAHSPSYSSWRSRESECAMCIHFPCCCSSCGVFISFVLCTLTAKHNVDELCADMMCISQSAEWLTLILPNFSEPFFGNINFVSTECKHKTHTHCCAPHAVIYSLKYNLI